MIRHDYMKPIPKPVPPKYKSKEVASIRIESEPKPLKPMLIKSLPLKKKVFSTKCLRIESKSGPSVKDKHLKEKKQPEKENEISKLKFLDLDEDYIFQIFDHLSLVDLCAMAKVSKYFRALTRLYFLLKYGDFDFNLLLPNENEDFNFAQAENVFDSFGDLIVSLIVSTQYFNDAMLRKIFCMINKKCIGTIEQVIIEHLDIESEAIDELVPLMDELIQMDSPFYHFDVPGIDAVCFELSFGAEYFVLLPQCKFMDSRCICD